MSEPWDEEDEQTVAAMVDRGRAWIMERAAEAKAERERRATEVTTEAGRRLLDHARTVLLSRGTATITIVDGDVIDDVKAIEAEAGSLDRAWAEAEAALPEDWWFEVGSRGFDGHMARAFDGRRRPQGDPESLARGFGPTPAAALDALAGRLSSVADSEET